MKNIWMYIDRKNWEAGKKYRVLLLILGLLYMLCGLAAWLIIRTRAFSSIDWMFCFIGYPVVISWITAFLYTSRHEFHNGNALAW